MDARAHGLTLNPSVAARDPGFVAGVRRAADEVVPSKIGEAHGRAAAGEIGRRGDEETPRALELSGDETRIRKVADSERKVGPFGDQILVAIGHHQIDLEQRMPGEERREQRHDAPDAIFGRQGDAQHAGEAVGAARRALRLVDREQGVARPGKQRLAGVGGGDLPGGSDQKLDAQSALERRDSARHGGLGEAEFARGLGEASALHRPHEQGELLQPIIHTGNCIYHMVPAQYPSLGASLSSRPSNLPTQSGRRGE